LGVIFAQKGAWKTGHYALNAIFQLDNALKTAARRDARDGSYQPLPELRAQLAQGYQATGDAASARATYLAAAQAYLDPDALELARRTLQSATALPSPAASDRDVVSELDRVIAARSDVDAAAGRQLDPSAADYAFRADGAHGWLFGQSLRLPAPFVDRQRFKRLADLAVGVNEAGHRAAAGDLAAQALSIAIERITVFTGPGDMVRIEKLRPIATSARVLDQKPLVQGTFKSTQGGVKTWK